MLILGLFLVGALAVLVALTDPSVDEANRKFYPNNYY